MKTSRNRNFGFHSGIRFRLDTTRTSRELVILRDKNIRRSRVKGILSLRCATRERCKFDGNLGVAILRESIVPRSSLNAWSISRGNDRKYFFYPLPPSPLLLLLHNFCDSITRNPNVKAISKRYPYMRNGLKELSQYDIDWPEYDPQNQRYLNLSKFSRLSCRLRRPLIKEIYEW